MRKAFHCMRARAFEIQVSVKIFRNLRGGRPVELIGTESTFGFALEGDEELSPFMCGIQLGRGDTMLTVVYERNTYNTSPKSDGRLFMLKNDSEANDVFKRDVSHGDNRDIAVALPVVL